MTTKRPESSNVFHGAQELAKQGLEHSLQQIINRPDEVKRVLSYATDLVPRYPRVLGPVRRVADALKFARLDIEQQNLEDRGEKLKPSRPRSLLTKFIFRTLGEEKVAIAELLSGRDLASGEILDPFDRGLRIPSAIVSLFSLNPLDGIAVYASLKVGRSLVESLATPEEEEGSPEKRVAHKYEGHAEARSLALSEQMANALTAPFSTVKSYLERHELLEAYKTLSESQKLSLGDRVRVLALSLGQENFTAPLHARDLWNEFKRPINKSGGAISQVGELLNKIPLLPLTPTIEIVETERQLVRILGIFVLFAAGATTLDSAMMIPGRFAYLHENLIAVERLTSFAYTLNDGNVFQTGFTNYLSLVGNSLHQYLDPVTVAANETMGQIADMLFKSTLTLTTAALVRLVDSMKHQKITVRSHFWGVKLSNLLNSFADIIS